MLTKLESSRQWTKHLRKNQDKKSQTCDQKVVDSLRKDENDL